MKLSRKVKLPPHDPITLWSRGKMPGTYLSPYYLLVTRENAWDLPLTLLPSCWFKFVINYQMDLFLKISRRVIFLGHPEEKDVLTQLWIQLQIQMRQIQNRPLWGMSVNKAIFLSRLTICEFAYFNNTFTYTFINTMTNTDTNKRFTWNRLMCGMSQNKAILLIRQPICQCWFSVFYFCLSVFFVFQS